MAWAPDYVTAPDLRAFLRIEDNADDAQIALAISTASRAVDKHCGRQFGKVDAPEVRTYTAVYNRRTCVTTVDVDDVQDITGAVVLHSNGTTLSSVTWGPANAVVKGKAYTRVEVATAGLLTIEALWGWTAVPAAVKQATLLQASRLMARRDSPFGVAGSPSEGSEIRLLAKVDPDVATSLGSYRRNWWAA